MKPDVKEALTRLTDGDEELIEQFDEVLNETNRTIEEENLVRREEEVEPEAEAEPVEEEVEAEEEEAEEEAEPVAEVEEEEPEVVEQAFPEIGELELDDEVVERIAETALQSEHIISEFELRDGDIAELKKGIEELQAIVRGLQDLPKRVTALELSDDEKRQVWLEDQPKKAEKITVTYRPREDPEKESEEEESMASKAEDTLEKMPTYK
jgi:hypothetical protein